MGSGLSQQTRDRLYTCKKNGGKELTLANCELKKIPSVAWKFKQLHRLNVSRNLLQLIPPDIKLLPLLAELDASTNEINEIAPDIGVLDSLTHLDLSNNSITSLPILPKSLKILKLSFNNITSSGELDFPVINELYYGHNKITIFPPQILTYQSIRVLDLSGNRLTYVPDEISNLGTLEALDLSDNQFNAVPVSISLLTNLRTLNIGGNPVGGMFREILELTKLEFLNANKCRLTTVDMDIGKLVNLTELHLKENNILEFPRSFCNGLEKLTNLRVLDVSMSALTVLPRYLVQLRKLLANNNNIKTIPGELCLLNPAVDISFSSNPLEYPFSQYLAEGIPTLLDHIQPFMKAYAPACVIEEELSVVHALKPLQCTIQANDFKSRPRKTGGDQFEAFLISDEDNRKVDAYVKPMKECPGKYQLFFNLPSVGAYHLHCTFDDAHIQGSPFAVVGQ